MSSERPARSERLLFNLANLAGAQVTAVCSGGYAALFIKIASWLGLQETVSGMNASPGTGRTIQRLHLSPGGANLTLGMVLTCLAVMLPKRQLADHKMRNLSCCPIRSVFPVSADVSGAFSKKDKGGSSLTGVDL